MDAILGYHLIPVAYSAEKLTFFAPFSVKPFTGGVLRFAKGSGGRTVVRGEQNTAEIIKAGLDAGRHAQGSGFCR